MFLHYRTAGDAKVAFNKLNNLKFDKNHTIQCVHMSDLRSIIEGDLTEQKELRLPTFTSSEQRYGFNLDEQARDQFLVR